MSFVLLGLLDAHDMPFKGHDGRRVLPSDARVPVLAIRRYDAPETPQLAVPFPIPPFTLQLFELVPIIYPLVAATPALSGVVKNWRCRVEPARRIAGNILSTENGKAKVDVIANLRRQCACGVLTGTRRDRHHYAQHIDCRTTERSA